MAHFYRLQTWRSMVFLCLALALVRPGKNLMAAQLTT
jgi:hypothetical protein